MFDDVNNNDVYNIYFNLFNDSKNDVIFNDLMSLILSKENVFRAYREIKNSAGSKVSGLDGKSVKDLDKLTLDEIVDNVSKYMVGSVHGYRPKTVLRKIFVKDNGVKRILGIPCIWDRLIQQCIKQVLESICEAKFSDNSFGFRPNRNVENAIALFHYRMNKSKMKYVIEFDIRNLFDIVNQSKLIRQLWNLGIHDKTLIYVIRKMLKSSVKDSDGKYISFDKGVFQAGILAPLLSNIVLNEFDHWVDSQWFTNPLLDKYSYVNKNGALNRGYAYSVLRKRTDLKEMYLVRYGNNIRILCNDYRNAKKIRHAVIDWFKKRLKLDLSLDDSKIVDLKKKCAEFLGFDIGLCENKNKYIARSHISYKSLNRQANMLISQINNIRSPRFPLEEREEVVIYNNMVLNFQDYYCLATNASGNYAKLQYRIERVLKNRLKSHNETRVKKDGRKLTSVESKRYGNSKMLRYIAESKEPVYPIGYIKHKNPMQRPKDCCIDFDYSSDSLKGCLLWDLIRKSKRSGSVEFFNNKLALFDLQKGKCFVTGNEFTDVSQIHCHHKVPVALGGSDSIDNLVLIDENVHRLIHAVDDNVIDYYKFLLDLNKSSLCKVNLLRNMIGLSSI